MRERISQLPAGDILNSVEIHTFHSFCHRLLKSYGCYSLNSLMKFEYFDRNFTIIDDGAKVLQSLLKNNQKMDCNIKDMFSKIIALKEDEVLGVTKSPLLGSLDDRHLVSQFRKLYDAELVQSNSMDFTDLQINLLRLLSEFPSVRQEIQHHYRHVIIDEYQDTSAIQDRIVRLLYQHVHSSHSDSTPSINSLFQTSDHRDQRSLFVVGDVNQSIYGWRGADVRGMDRLAQDFQHTCQTYSLRDNYRSSPQIIAVANAIIGRDGLSGRPAHPAQIEEAQGGHRGATSPPVYVYHALNDAAEAAFIARSLKSLPNMKKGILFRTAAQARALEVCACLFLSSPLPADTVMPSFPNSWLYQRLG